METNMKCENGYVVLPVETYDELTRNDLRNYVSVDKAADNSWDYGEVNMCIQESIIGRAVESIKDKIDPEAVIKFGNVRCAIAIVPREIMDKRLELERKGETE